MANTLTPEQQQVLQAVIGTINPQAPPGTAETAIDIMNKRNALDALLGSPGGGAEPMPDQVLPPVSMSTALSSGLPKETLETMLPTPRQPFLGSLAKAAVGETVMMLPRIGTNIVDLAIGEKKWTPKFTNAVKDTLGMGESDLPLNTAGNVLGVLAGFLAPTMAIAKGVGLASKALSELAPGVAAFAEAMPNTFRFVQHAAEGGLQELGTEEPTLTGAVGFALMDTVLRSRQLANVVAPKVFKAKWAREGIFTRTWDIKEMQWVRESAVTQGDTISDWLRNMSKASGDSLDATVAAVMRPAKIDLFKDATANAKTVFLHKSGQSTHLLLDYNGREVHIALDTNHDFVNATDMLLSGAKIKTIAGPRQLIESFRTAFTAQTPGEVESILKTSLAKTVVDDAAAMAKGVEPPVRPSTPHVHLQDESGNIKMVPMRINDDIRTGVVTGKYTIVRFDGINPSLEADRNRAAEFIGQIFGKRYSASDMPGVYYTGSATTEPAAIFRIGEGPDAIHQTFPILASGDISPNAHAFIDPLKGKVKLVAIQLPDARMQDMAFRAQVRDTLREYAAQPGELKAALERAAKPTPQEAVAVAEPGATPLAGQQTSQEIIPPGGAAESLSPGASLSLTEAHAGVAKTPGVVDDGVSAVATNPADDFYRSITEAAAAAGYDKKTTLDIIWRAHTKWDSLSPSELTFIKNNVMPHVYEWIVAPRTGEDAAILSELLGKRKTLLDAITANATRDNIPLGDYMVRMNMIRNAPSRIIEDIDLEFGKYGPFKGKSGVPWGNVDTAWDTWRATQNGPVTYVFSKAILTLASASNARIFAHELGHLAVFSMNPQAVKRILDVLHREAQGILKGELKDLGLLHQIEYFKTNLNHPTAPNEMLATFIGDTFMALKNNPSAITNPAASEALSEINGVIKTAVNSIYDVYGVRNALSEAAYNDIQQVLEHNFWSSTPARVPGKINAVDIRNEVTQLFAQEFPKEEQQTLEAYGMAMRKVVVRKMLMQNPITREAIENGRVVWTLPGEREYTLIRFKTLDDATRAQAWLDTLQPSADYRRAFPRSTARGVVRKGQVVGISDAFWRERIYAQQRKWMVKIDGGSLERSVEFLKKAGHNTDDLAAQLKAQYEELSVAVARNAHALLGDSADELISNIRLEAKNIFGTTVNIPEDVWQSVTRVTEEFAGEKSHVEMEDIWKGFAHQASEGFKRLVRFSGRGKDLSQGGIVYKILGPHIVDAQGEVVGIRNAIKITYFDGQSDLIKKDAAMDTIVDWLLRKPGIHTRIRSVEAPNSEDIALFAGRLAPEANAPRMYIHDPDDPVYKWYLRNGDRPLDEKADLCVETPYLLERGGKPVFDLTAGTLPVEVREKLELGWKLQAVGGNLIPPGRESVDIHAVIEGAIKNNVRLPEGIEIKLQPAQLESLRTMAAERGMSVRLVDTGVEFRYINPMGREPIPVVNDYESLRAVFDNAALEKDLVFAPHELEEMGPFIKQARKAVAEEVHQDDPANPGASRLAAQFQKLFKTEKPPQLANASKGVANWFFAGTAPNHFLAARLQGALKDFPVWDLYNKIHEGFKMVEHYVGLDFVSVGKVIRKLSTEEQRVVTHYLQAGGGNTNVLTQAEQATLSAFEAQHKQLLSPKIKDAAKKIRAWYLEMGEKGGAFLNPDNAPYVDAYVPWRIYLDNRIQRLAESATGSVTDRPAAMAWFTKARIETEWNPMYDDRIGSLMAQYAYAMRRQEHIMPLSREATQMLDVLKQIEDANNGKLPDNTHLIAKLFLRNINNVMTQQDGPVSANFYGGLYKLLSKLTGSERVAAGVTDNLLGWGYGVGLGFRPGSAVRNTLFAPVPVYMMVGGKHLAEGLRRYQDLIAKGTASEYSALLDPIHATYASRLMNNEGEIYKAMISNMNVNDSTFKKALRASLWMQEKSERFARTMSYMAGTSSAEEIVARYAKSKDIIDIARHTPLQLLVEPEQKLLLTQLATGQTEQFIRSYANATVRMTQFAYGPIESFMMGNTKVGKLAFFYGTWSANFLHMLNRMRQVTWQNAKMQPWSADGYRFLARWIAGTSVGYATMSAMGANPSTTFSVGPQSYVGSPYVQAIMDLYDIARAPGNQQYARAREFGNRLSQLFTPASGAVQDARRAMEDVANSESYNAMIHMLVGTTPMQEAAMSRRGIQTHAPTLKAIKGALGVSDEKTRHIKQPQSPTIPERIATMTGAISK